MNKCITTPIFYASGDPHIGHVYSAYVADTLKRYYQLCGNKTLLLTGTDENGEKIERKAHAEFCSPEEFVARKSSGFRSLWNNLGIDFDIFVRTSQLEHHNKVREIWRKFLSNGDIYIGTYEGLYCVDCEQFYPEWQREGNCCPIHKNTLEKVSEPCYLFRLEKYRQQLLDFFKTNPKFIVPHHYQVGLIRQLEKGSQEVLAVSRTKIKWGIQVPDDENHIIYVWLDALFSYLSGLRDAGLEAFDIANTEHVIGKDIVQFHGIYWLSFLLAADLPFPKRLIVHGWWTVNGEKISKSNPATVINPLRIVAALGNDGLRYALLQKKALDRDGDISIGELVDCINSDLANGLGNLVKRYTTLVDKYFARKIVCENICLGEDSRTLLSSVSDITHEVSQAYQQAEFSKVCRLVNEVVADTNVYIHSKAPWLLYKSGNIEATKEVLCVIYAVLEVICVLYIPILPNISAKIQSQLYFQNALSWPSCCELKSVKVQEPESIFERLKLSEVESALGSISAISNQTPLN